MQPATPPSGPQTQPTRPHPPSPPAKRRRTTTAYTSQNPSPLTPSPPPHPPPISLQQSSSAKWFRKPSVVWYRGHDLRVEDHPALLAAAQRGGPVVPLFVWDASDGFGAGLGHVKQWWLRQSLIRLQSDLRRLGVQLYTRVGQSTEQLRAFLEETGADAVFWNRCYEPNLLTRDEELRVELAAEGLTAESFKAELLVEPWELSNTDVAPCFDTFHAFMRAWMTVPPPPQPFPCPSRLQPISRLVASVSIDSLDFDIPPNVHKYMSKVWTPGSKQAKVQLAKFLREVFPAFGEERCRRHVDGTSRLSPHIRFGELSPRRMYHATRLRVSRWDQSLVFRPANQDSDKSPPAKHDSTVSKPRRKPPSARTSHANGTANNKRQRDSVEKFSNSGDDADVSGSNGTRIPPTDIREGMGAAKREKSTDADDSRQSTPAAVRRRSLPHISLSARAFLKNLCLRDFSYHVLFHNPDFNTRPLIPQFSSFPWAEDNGAFDSWREGKTGYPIVDAAMRELRATGWIHNGMRFLLACFLTKYLLLPWAAGLREFYKLLIDGDHSSNALGWQWTAGSNTDAFPVSCLVNPVKVAYRHDPTGSYVRRWLPELAKLPTEYVHQPWKAPAELLKSSGVELGKNYPNRIVQMNEARVRAMNAMRVMKRIFSGWNMLRNIFRGKGEDIIKEWPVEEPEVLEVDESAPLSGKMSLLPSLWALLQCDQPSTYLSGSSLGSDPLIAMGTASLTEGSLAVPSGDQHESIEHALITAHEQPSSDAFLAATPEGVSADTDMDTSSFVAREKSDETTAVQPDDTNILAEVPPLDEHMKFVGTNVDTSQEVEKLASQPSDAAVMTRLQAERATSRQRSSKATTAVPFTPYSSAVPLSSPSVNVDISHTPYPQPPQQQYQSFQQLQQLQYFQLQQFNMLQQQHPTHPSHLQPQPQPHPLQHHSTHVHSVMEDTYASGANVGSVPRGSVAGVPMTAPPVMVGPATSAPEVGVNTVFPGADGSNGAYPHQFGMGQLYGYPVLPMVNPHMAGNERSDVTGASGGPNGPKMAMSGVMPMGYGMYGSNVFDPALLGNAFAGNGTPYNAMSVSSQQQTPGGPQNPYNLSPHTMAMYFSTPQTPDAIQPQGVGPMSQLAAASHGREKLGASVASVPAPASSVAAAAAAAVAAGGRELAINVASESQNRSAVKGRPSANFASGQTNDNTGQFVPPLQNNNDVLHSPGVSSTDLRGSKGTQNRPNSKSTAKAKTSGRSRRNSSSAGGRGRGDSRAQGSPRSKGDGNASVSQKRNEESSPQNATTLKTRQEMLAAVLEKEDHEYHGFAQYLSITYELTGNTDRHTSKDYIRLCNLKDDYHKQCTSEKEKLKIYRIKAFFSKVLKLQVTGEWDRHNHGGVRGPYVYGIRIQRAPESSQAPQS